MNKEVLIEVKNLKKYFKVGSSKKTLKAVDDVSLKIYKGETFGLVGESGCGKSTLGRTITKLYQPNDGKIIYQGIDITNLKSKEFKTYQKKMQIIFQDPYSALNPSMNVKEIIEEPIYIHNNNIGKEDVTAIVEDVIKKVGLSSDCISKFPYEFSGGQRQRIGIARSLSVNPDFILCDEPISALDVSIQAQVVNTLKDIQEQTNVTYLFVAHDLSMVKYISDRIGVMYLGRIVEVASSEELYANPKHPYTQILIDSIPQIDKELDIDEEVISGDIPSPIDLPKGCRFASRCNKAFDKCYEVDPMLIEVDDNHQVACLLHSNENKIFDKKN